MEDETKEAGPSGRQSKIRRREGYVWTTCSGLPSEVQKELSKVKRRVRFRYRDDVVEAALGEVGLLDPYLRSGYPNLKPKEDGGGTLYFLLPEPLVACVAQAAGDLPFRVETSSALAAILVGIKDQLEPLARQGMARKMGGAA